MEREYACGNCGLIFWGSNGGEIGKLYPACPECGAKMGDHPGLHTVDSTGWIYAEPEVARSLSERGKHFHVREGLFPEQYREVYCQQGLLEEASP